MHLFSPPGIPTIDLQRVQTYVSTSPNLEDLQEKLTHLHREINQEVNRLLAGRAAASSMSSASTPFPIRNTYSHANDMAEELKPFQDLRQSLENILLTLQLLRLPLEHQRYLINWLRVLYNTVGVKVRSCASLAPEAPTASIIKTHLKKEILDVTIKEFEPFPEAVWTVMGRDPEPVRRLIHYIDTPNFTVNHDALSALMTGREDCQGLVGTLPTAKRSYVEEPETTWKRPRR